MSKTYQEKAYETAAYGSIIEYPFTSLAEEAGEVMGKINKFIRKHEVSVHGAVFRITKSSELDAVGTKLREDVIKELGDLQWQIAACCTELGITLDQLQESNLEKLRGRVKRGTIEGEGDNR